ncbi:MAG TPA: class I SAM-dependent methyltransferase [Kofleriaceae bacterium]|jgi:ubiquinone/menaquinone biosynthesis C-methylase UbiE
MMFHPHGPTFRELMRQALASTERGYDLLAPKFDLTPFRTPEPVLDAMDGVIGPVGAALDVCCGTGAMLRHLDGLASDRVAGIDFSHGMLAEARRHVPRAELLYGDARDLPFDQEFDVATCVGALGHVEPADEDRFVGGIARALRPGGRFVFATSHRPAAISPWLWAAHAFNAVMRVRNAVRTPAFVMYYLTFLWPEVRPLLERHGLAVEARERLCAPPFQRAVIVVATRR